MAINNLQALRKVVVIAMACLAISAVVLGDLMVTNAAGVRAGITGIVRSNDAIRVSFAVFDPTGSNATTFTFQSSQDLITWTNILDQSLTYTGNVSGEVSGGFATPQAKFYRMYLINFQ